MVQDTGLFRILKKAFSQEKAEIEARIPPKLSPALLKKVADKKKAQAAASAGSSKPSVSKKATGNPKAKVTPTQASVPQTEAPKPRAPKSVTLPKDLSSLLLLADDEDNQVRHAAVKRLAKLKNPETIPGLIPRANDSVAQIRNTAITALMALAKPENASTYVLMLPEVFALRDAQSPNHAFINDIERYLLTRENVTEVLNGFLSDDSSISQASFSLVVKYKLLKPGDFVLRGLQHTSFSVRIKASQYLKELEGEKKERALELAIKDECVPVRREALLILLKLWGNEVLAKEFLFDDHSELREIAILHLGRLGDDVEHTYLRNLSDENELIICCSLWGLAYLDSKDCVGQVRPFLKHPSKIVRKYATVTMRKLASVEEKKTLPEWNQRDTFIS